MTNETRTLNDDQLDRVITHFELLYNNHKYLAHSFRAIDSKEILIFILQYIQPSENDIEAIEDDSLSIAQILINNKILIPLM